MNRDKDKNEEKSNNTKGIIPREFVFKDYYIHEGNVKVRTEVDDELYIQDKKSNKDKKNNY